MRVMSIDIPASAQVLCVSREQVAEHAFNLAQQLRAGMRVALVGDLGAGKTTYAQALLQALGVSKNESTLSPTFSYLNSYSTHRGEIHHLDLYRSPDEETLFALGLIDAMSSDSAISLVEWAHLFPRFFQESTWWLVFEVQPNQDRKIYAWQV